MHNETACFSAYSDEVSIHDKVYIYKYNTTDDVWYHLTSIHQGINTHNFGYTLSTNDMFVAVGLRKHHNDDILYLCLTTP